MPAMPIPFFHLMAIVYHIAELFWDPPTRRFTQIQLGKQLNCASETDIELSSRALGGVAINRYAWEGRNIPDIRRKNYAYQGSGLPFVTAINTNQVFLMRRRSMGIEIKLENLLEQSQTISEMQMFHPGFQFGEPPIGAGSVPDPAVLPPRPGRRSAAGSSIRPLTAGLPDGILLVTKPGTFADHSDHMILSFFSLDPPRQSLSTSGLRGCPYSVPILPKACPNQLWHRFWLSISLAMQAVVTSLLTFDAFFLSLRLYR
ncbi:hypothetical protein B0H19DRAFT_1055632 [Mycena capillaripes]|nr:hypothetical protein B0H19DRAFT_1055632 [Mycena capillaripes]